jgi:hypothetical protein
MTMVSFVRISGISNRKRGLTDDRIRKSPRDCKPAKARTFPVPAVRGRFRLAGSNFRASPIPGRLPCGDGL